MQYQVPQFIEIEDKIIGPLTLRQFMWLGGGGGLGFILFQVIKPSFFAPLFFLVMAVAIVFAFVKVNGRPFTSFLGSLMNFTTRPTFYIWKRIPKTEKSGLVKEEEMIVQKTSTNESRLKELTRTIDMPENHENT